MGNEAVGALNWIAGFWDGPTYSEPDPMQLEVLERICELASRRHPGPPRRTRGRSPAVARACS
eukprot:9500939-Pyramimonas_sp.AAC.1